MGKAVLAWRGSFKTAGGTMLAKTKRSMSKGLQGMAQSVLDLIAASSCGEVKTLARLKDQADRLRVLASSSMGFLDSGKVKYEPLKELVVGDVDIHVEINKLIIAWQMKKGPDETGKALTDFFAKFG